MTAHGTCHPRFGRVRAAFEANFGDGEVGASVCVTHQGEVVVDLAGGVADPGCGTAWTADTLVMVWSCTKGALAACVHGLAGLGQLDLESPARRYWPELAGDGRDGITVASLLAHQAGLPGLSEPLPAGAVFDWDEMTARLERERPRWEPGTRHGYHSFTFGWLLGELVHRVTGLKPGDFFREHVARPLAIDFHIGLPPSEDHRVARVLMAAADESPRSPFREALERGDALQVAVANSMGDFAAADVCERREARAAQVPAANGIANARALALLYMPLALGDPLGDLPLTRESRRRMQRVESAVARDAVTLAPTRFSSGFQKSTARRGWHQFAIAEQAFGHTGFGNSFGFADPVRRLSMGYAMNRHAPAGDNVRHQRLIDAAYRATGCHEPP